MKNMKGREIPKTSAGLADLKLVFDKRQWMPVACYLFGIGIIINPLNKTFFLCLTEDRQLKNIWTPFGGEVSYKDFEQFIKTMNREIYEESGVLIDPKKALILDSEISYPGSRDNPYKETGVISVITSYIYPLKEGEKPPLIDAQIHEEGCRVIEIREFSFPKIWKLLESGEIKAYPSFEKTLKKLEVWFLENIK